MTTGILNGTLMALYIGGVKVANLVTNGFSLSRPTRETSNKDSGNWATKKHKRASWSMNGNAMVAFDAGYGVDDIFDAIVNSTEVAIMTSTEVVGDIKYWGTALVTEFSPDFPDDDNSTYSVTFEGTGQLNESLVLT